eukprot:scaffold12989_cov77-Phaeocystis_antarctica.AAC.1
MSLGGMPPAAARSTMARRYERAFSIADMRPTSSALPPSPRLARRASDRIIPMAAAADISLPITAWMVGKNFMAPSTSMCETTDAMPLTATLLR